MLTTNLITQELHIIKSFRKFVNLCARLGLGQLQRANSARGSSVPFQKANIHLLGESPACAKALV